MAEMTKPQTDLLRQVVSHGRLTCSTSYPPAKKLVDLKYVEWQRGRFSDHLVATDAGRAAVKAGDGR